MPTKAYAAQAADQPLAPWTLDRRDPGPTDVALDILFCGVCHSDLHTARNEWQNTVYPVVPGHEIIGRVTQVGNKVTKLKVGDLAGVGCMVGSCGACEPCKGGLEQYCQPGCTFTYNSPDPLGPGAMTYGGYSTAVVVDESFALKVPAGLDPAAAAPLLCAGITTYSPLRHWRAGPGKTVGVVGLGGLGHMGVKFAHALGAHTVLFTTSPDKVADGKRLGADEVVVSKNADAMAAQKGRFDLILDCVSADHDLNAYLQMLKLDGTLVLVGAPERPLPVSAFSVIPGRKSFAGSMIGGIAETQEMLDFCGPRGITCDVEMIRMQEINTAYERMLRGDVRYRFVIDLASLKG